MSWVSFSFDSSGRKTKDEELNFFLLFPYSVTREGETPFSANVFLKSADLRLQFKSLMVAQEDNLLKSLESCLKGKKLREKSKGTNNSRDLWTDVHTC